jgi:hypothetical protein
MLRGLVYFSIRQKLFPSFDFGGESYLLFLQYSTASSKFLQRFTIGNFKSMLAGEHTSSPVAARQTLWGGLKLIVRSSRKSKFGNFFIVL